MPRREAEEPSSRLEQSQQEGLVQGSQTPSLSGQTLIATHSHFGSNEQPLPHETASSTSPHLLVGPRRTSSGSGQYPSHGILRWLNQTFQEEPWSAVTRARNSKHEPEAERSGNEKPQVDHTSGNGTTGK